MADTATLPTLERRFVEGLLEKAAGLASAVEVAKRLALLLRRHSQENLDAVLTAAETTPLARFVAELRKELPAVPAALAGCGRTQTGFGSATSTSWTGLTRPSPAI
jgi:hypothetical protein